MEHEITCKDLSVLQTAGLKAFMDKFGVPWGRTPGLTNNERRDALWVRLAGDGKETATVDAAWWAAARAMASKDPPSKFEELEKVDRLKLSRTLTPGRGGNPEGAGPSRTPGSPRTPSQASRTQEESLSVPLGAEEKISFSMDKDAMGTDRVGAAEAIKRLGRAVEPPRSQSGWPWRHLGGANAPSAPGAE